MSRTARIPALAAWLAVLSLLIACETTNTGTSSSPAPHTRPSHSKGVARMLVDFSNSFAPFDDARAKQVDMILGSLAKHIVRNWSLSGTFSVHGIDATTVTAPPLCPPMEYKSGGLLHASPAVDLPKVASACARLVRTRSLRPATVSDITNAVNIAAASFPPALESTRLIGIISDFVDTGRSRVAMDSLQGIDILMVYAPEKTATNANDYLNRISDWERRFKARGANSVRKIQLHMAIESELLTLLQDRIQ